MSAARKLGASAFAVTVFLIITPVVALMLFFGTPDCGDTGSLSAEASAEIPPEVAQVYVAMAAKWDLDVAFLASIGYQEGDHGRNPATKVVNSAGCVGHMQLGVGGRCGRFWYENQCDGDGDGVMDVMNMWDNICAAAKGLRHAKGAPPAGGSEEGYYRAACGYYGACADANANYAPEVMARAKRYGFVSGTRTDASALPVAAGGAAAPTGPVLSVGDSLGVGSEAELQRLLGDRDLRPHHSIGRSTAQGLATLQGIADRPATWVIQLGTNDTNAASFRTSVRKILALAQTDGAQVFWVNISRKDIGGDGADKLNAVLEDELSGGKGTILDWHARVKSGTVTLSDGVHPSGDGYKNRAALIADSLTAGSGAQAASCAAGTLAGGGNPDAEALSKHKNIVWRESQIQDLLNGRISPKLVAKLDTIAAKHKIVVTAMATDHSPGSNHQSGRAVDIAIVGSDNCAPPDKAGDCWKLAQELDSLEVCEGEQITELIYYFDPGPNPGSFAQADHDDHIHSGWDGPLGPKTYKTTDPCSPEAISGG